MSLVEDYLRFCLKICLGNKRSCKLCDGQEMLSKMVLHSLVSVSDCMVMKAKNILRRNIEGKKLLAEVFLPLKL